MGAITDAPCSAFLPPDQINFIESALRMYGSHGVNESDSERWMAISSVVNSFTKLALYLRSVVALGAPNLDGCPLIPKALWRSSPHSRNAYNSFLFWIHRLGIERASTIIDVGANHGDFARAASATFPQANVLLFEPLPTMHDYLNGLMRAGRKTWQLLPCGLGSAPGEFPLFVDDKNDAIGSFAGFADEYLRANPLAQPNRKIMCNVRTLDEVASELGLESIDLVKIDVEGFEFEVLKGATVSLQRTNSIIVEVSLLRHSATSATPLLEMLQILTSVGFQVVEIIPSLFDPAVSWKPTEFNVLMRRSPGSNS